METLYEKIYSEYIRKYKMIDKEILCDIVNEYINNKKIFDSILSINFTKSGELEGSYHNKEIKICISRIILNTIIRYQIDKNNLTFNDYIEINMAIINVLYHELTHAKQRDILINNYEFNKELYNILNDSYLRTYDKELYLQNHDIFITEYNANMEGAILTDRIYNYIKTKIEGTPNEELYNLVNRHYINGYKGSTPLEKYNQITGNSFKYVEGLSEYDNLCYGMPITKELKKIARR